MYYMIDNNDSFVYNLASYFEKLGQNIVVENINTVNIERLNSEKIKGIIISPGPGTPEQATISNNAIKLYSGKIPILGVCLGHQVIGHCFGATIRKGIRPMHGKLSLIRNNGERLFRGLPDTFKVTRYHSLVIDEKSIPSDFIVDARSSDQNVMAISHQELPIFGVQFHPEALLTDYGYEILENYIKICDKWGIKHA